MEHSMANLDATEPLRPHPRGTLSVKFYPPRIDDDALLVLRDLAAETLHSVAPRFITWLVDWCDGEFLRRLCGMSDDVQEADLPQIPIFGWTDRDVAEALVAVTHLSFTCRS